MAVAGSLWIRIGATTDGLARGVAKAQGLVSSLSGGIRYVGRSLLRAGDMMFNFAENFTQAMVVAVAAVIGLAVYAASKTAEGQAEINKLSQAFNKLLQAVAPIGIVMLKMANEAMPPIIAGAQKLNKWFMGLSKDGQRLTVAILLFLAALGPVVMMIASFTLLLGALSWAFGALFSPIGLVIIIILKLVATFVYLWKTNEEFRNNVITLWNEIKTAFMTAFGPIIDWFVLNWPRIKQIATDTFIKMHTEIIPIIAAIVKWLIEKIGALVQWFIAHWPQIKAIFMKVWNAIVSFVMPIVREIVKFLMDQFTMWQEWWDQHGQMIWNAIKRVFKLIVGAIKIAMEVIWNVFKVVWPHIKDMTIAIWNIIKAVIDGAMKIIRSIIQLVTAVIMGDWKAAWDAMKNLFKSGWEMMKSIVTNLLTAIAEFIVGAVKGLVTIVYTLLIKLAANWKDILGGIFKWLTGIDLADVGRDIVAGLARGISNAVGKVKSAVKSLTKYIPNWAKDWLGIHSPSKVMMELGGYTTDGFAVGMLDTIKRVKRATSTMVSAAIPAKSQIPSSPLPVGSSSHSAGGVTFNFYGPVHVRNDEDIEKLAHKFAELSNRNARVDGGSTIL